MPLGVRVCVCPAVEMAACFLVTTAMANCAIGSYCYIRIEPDELNGNISDFRLSYVRLMNHLKPNVPIPNVPY